MKVAELLESRRANWRALETFCELMERRGRPKLAADGAARFAALYRAVCADLALADAYQLPPSTINYLHQLVGRAHNQLYRSRTFDFRAWGRDLFQEVPRRLFLDKPLRLAMLIFWGLFFFSMFLAYTSPSYAEQALGEEGARQMQDSFSKRMSGRAANESSLMIGFYINHNAGIGLSCFASGLLLGIGGLFATAFNAAFLGAAFGYMATTPERFNFFEFVTAHGPFELTAIVFSAAAGMRMGFAIVETHGLTRSESLRKAAMESMPVAGTAVLLFVFAALIEAFLSPSAAPYPVKAAVAIVSALLLIFYVFVLGFPRSGQRAVR